MSNTDIQDDYIEWVTIHTLNNINISLHKMIYYKFGTDKTYACVYYHMLQWKMIGIG